MTENVSHFILPAVLIIPSILFFIPGKDYLGAFLRGARSGLETAVSLIPPLTLIMCAVSMFSSCGAAEALSKIVSPFFRIIGIPENVLPLLLTRPFSGSAASASYTDLLNRSGADSFSSFFASVIMGSSDTVFYIIAVYFSVCPRVKHTGYLYPVAVASSLFCVFFSAYICRLFY